MSCREHRSIRAPRCSSGSLSCPHMRARDGSTSASIGRRRSTLCVSLTRREHVSARRACLTESKAWPTSTSWSAHTPRTPETGWLGSKPTAVCQRKGWWPPDTRYALNPFAVSRYRDRHTVSRAKSDPGDAKVLAELVRTDRQNHRPLAGDSELAESLKVLARTHQTLVWARVRHANQLRSSLREFYLAALDALGTNLAGRERTRVARPSNDARARTPALAHSAPQSRRAWRPRARCCGSCRRLAASTPLRSCSRPPGWRVRTAARCWLWYASSASSTLRLLRRDRDLAGPWPGSRLTSYRRGMSNQCIRLTSVLRSISRD